jgi:DNA ligase-1
MYEVLDSPRLKKRKIIESDDEEDPNDAPPGTFFRMLPLALLINFYIVSSQTVAANLSSSPSQIASSPTPLSQNTKRKEKQTAGTAKPATVEDESERSSSEDEGEDEIDAEEAEESTSDKVANTKRFDSVSCAKKDPAHLRVWQCSIRPHEKGRRGHRRWMESRRTVRISFNIEDKV